MVKKWKCHCPQGTSESVEEHFACNEYSVKSRGFTNRSASGGVGREGNNRIALRKSP